jgi:hypothetical protein
MNSSNELKNIIPNIFHVFYDENKNHIFQYFSIESIFQLNCPEKIYIYTYEKNKESYYLEKYKDKIIYEKINQENIKKELYIFQKLKKIGGIFCDINLLFILPINQLLKYNFFKSDDNSIIGSEIDSYMLNKYIDYLSLNKESTDKFTEKFGIRNINNVFINNYIIPENKIYSSVSLFDEIKNYTFSEYFNIINNYQFVYLDDSIFINEYNEKELMYDILNKHRTYNLIIKYILGYRYLNNNTLTYIQKENISFIDNIDVIIWINLNRSNDRKENMLYILNNFNIINYRLSAIDGSEILNVKENFFIKEDNQYLENNKFSNKEFATLLSHLNCIESYKNFNNLKYNVAMICEDDLSLDFINYWKKSINEIILNAPAEWDIIMLGYFSLNINYKEEYSKWNGEWSAICYLITHNGAKKLSKLKDVDGKWKYKDGDLMVADSYIFSKLNTYLYKYPYFTFPNNNNSTIHEDHVNYHYMYKNANYLVLENIYEQLI